MIYQDTNSGFLVVITLLAITLVCFNFSAYCFISYRIIKSQRNNPHYKKTPTVIGFNWLFISIILLLLAFIINFFFNAFWILNITSIIACVISSYTTHKYYSQTSVFEEKQIPEDLVKKETEDLKKSVLRKIQKYEVDDSMLNEMTTYINKH
tara:strand:+ start:284 stop:739 length:456 start_codon:yes stop_codon:yes gene_type:complete